MAVVNQGMTLLQTVLALILVGIAATIAIPEARCQLDRLAVDRAVYHAVAAHRLARMKAVTTNGVTVLHLAPDSVRIRVLAGRDTVQYWSRPGPLSDAVSLAGPARSVVFGPTGIGRGVGNGTWVFRRGHAAKSVVISRLGRLRVVP